MNCNINSTWLITFLIPRVKFPVYHCRDSPLRPPMAHMSQIVLFVCFFLWQVHLIMPYNTYTTAAPTDNTYFFASKGVEKVLSVIDFLQAFPAAFFFFCQICFQCYLSDPFALTWALNYSRAPCDKCHYPCAPIGVNRVLIWHANGIFYLQVTAHKVSQCLQSITLSLYARKTRMPSRDFASIKMCVGEVIALIENSVYCIKKKKKEKKKNSPDNRDTMVLLS